jgi:hypothetical protein
MASVKYDMIRITPIVWSNSKKIGFVYEKFQVQAPLVFLGGKCNYFVNSPRILKETNVIIFISVLKALWSSLP